MCIYRYINSYLLLNGYFEALKCHVTAHAHWKSVNIITELFVSTHKVSHIIYIHCIQISLKYMPKRD